MLLTLEAYMLLIKYTYIFSGTTLKDAIKIIFTRATLFA